MSFNQCSSPLAGSLNRLLRRSKRMLAALPHNRSCNNQCLFLHQSAYLDQNRNPAGYPGQMHHDQKIPHTEELYVNMYIRRANWQFGNDELRKCYWLGWVGDLAAVVSALESAVSISRPGVHLFLCISSVCAKSVWCHFGKEGSRTCGFNEA